MAKRNRRRAEMASIMSDEDGMPVDDGHVFNGGSQQPRFRSNIMRKEDWSRLHARRDRLFQKQRAVNEQSTLNALASIDIKDNVTERFRRAWAKICHEIFLSNVLKGGNK